ncbi:MAG TPA: hypothetical protein VNO70_14810 [Blastocatellia bacterium]|nr:hypothetical protein [Blastocatellia bacterium]
MKTIENQADTTPIREALANDPARLTAWNQLWDWFFSQPPAGDEEHGPTIQ